MSNRAQVKSTQAQAVEPPARIAEPAGKATRPVQPRGPLALSRAPANDAVPPPPLPGLGRGELPARDFAGLPSLRATGRIDDADAARALITRLLIDELAPLLGLDPARIRIGVDEPGRARLEARGASGLQFGDEILLHRKSYRPETSAGRYLLAHEAAHTAQRRNGIAARLPVVEDEAHEAALAFARRGRVRRPRFAPATTEPAAFEGPDPEKAFANLVRDNYAEELALIRRTMSYGVFDWAVTDGDIADVLRILEPLPFVTQVALVGSLEDPFPARLVDNISPGHFKRYRTSILAAYDALAQKVPSKLQDNPFDGMDFTGLSPEEHSALSRIIPAFISTSKGAAWFRRLNPRIAAHVQDIRSRAPTFDAAEARKTAMKTEQQRARERADDVEQRKSSDVAGFLDKARRKLTYHALDWAITDSETLSLLDDVAAFAESPGKLRAIVATLEGEGLMGRWVDNLPVQSLYTDASRIASGATINRRQVFLRVVSLRPAWKNAKAAEELLSYGLLDWAVTDEDAFLAFQLIKALPENVRAGLLTEGDYGSRLDDNLSLSMKKGRASNYYTGGKGGADLQSIKAQLLDDDAWTLEQTSRLRQLIQMARAADEGAWVFRQSKSRVEAGRLTAAYADRDFFSRVVQAFELYVPPGFVRPDGTVDAKGRTAYVAETLKGKAFGTDNFFYQYVIKGLGFLFSHTGRLQIFKESIGGEGLDLRELEPILGGSFAGVEFAEASEVLDANTAEMTDNSVRLDIDHGVFEMRAALLAISAVNYPTPNQKIQTGPIRIHGLNLHMEYPKNQVRTTTMMRLRIDRIDIADFLMIGAASMTGIERISVSELHIDMAPEAGATTLAPPDESVAIGAVLLTPIYNMLGIKGAIGALKQGLMEPMTAQELTATAGNVTLKGLTTSSGQFVQQISLSEIALRTRNTHYGKRYRAELLKQRYVLNRRLVALRAAPKPTSRPRHYAEFDTAGSLVRELRSVEAEIKALDDAEAEIKALEAKGEGVRLSPADQQRLDRRKAFLAGTDQGGIALDIGHAEAKGIAGRVTMGDASLDDVHAYGNSPGAVLGSLSGSPSVNRMLRGPDYRGTLAGVELEGDPNAFVKLGDLELNAFSLQGEIPTAEAAKKDYDEAEAGRLAQPFDPRLADNTRRLQTRWENAETYWTLLRAPVLDTKNRDAFNRARNALLQDKAFSFERFSATGATLELARDAKGVTQIGLDARTIGLQGVQAGGLAVKDVRGADVRLGVGVSLLDVVNRGRALQNAAISAGSLRFSGIEDLSTGLKAEQLNLTGLRARGDFAASGTSAQLGADSIELVGLNQVLTARVLEYRRDKLQTKPEAQRTAAEKAQLKDIAVLLEALEQAQAQLTTSGRHLDDPTISPADKAHYTQQKADAEQMLAFWQKSVELKKLTFRDLHIDVTGLGDVLGEGYSLNQAIRSGITVTGRGPGRQIVSGITAEGAWTRLSAGSVKDAGAGSRVTAGGRTSVEKLETGPIRGSITYAEDHVSIDGLEIASVEAQGLYYAGGDTVVNAKGGARIETIRVSARLDFALVDETLPAGDRRLSRLQISAFSIGRIGGHDIEYRNMASGLRVVLTSGALIGIHAEDAVVDFGATAGAPLLVRGGTAGFARLEDVRSVATTASGLAVASNLNTGALTARFADDGSIVADLQQISAGARVTQKDLDARVNARAKFLHLELLPGAEGYKDATQRGRLGGLDLDVKGTKGVTDPARNKSATRFGVKVDSFDSGEVIRTPDGRIEAPFITIPEITLTRLHVDDGAMVIDVPEGQPVQLAAIQTGITAEPNPTPAAQRGKDESPFSRIVIHDFFIPIIVMHALTVVLRNEEKGDLIVTLPPNRLGVLKNLRLKANDGSDAGFVLKPNENWNAFGTLGLESAEMTGIGADLRSALISSMDVKANNLSIDFIGADDTLFAVEDLEVTRLDGGLKSAGQATYADKTGSDPGVSDTIVSKLTRAGFHLSWSKWTNESKLHARGLKYSKKGGASVDSLDISGFRFEDPDRTLSIDIRKAILPAGKDGAPALQYTPQGKLIVPLAEIEDAAFTVLDVMKLGGSKKGAGIAPDNGLTFAPGLEVVDMLSGHVNFTVKPFLRQSENFWGSLGVFVAGPYAFRIAIDKGKINFHELEDKSTGNIADFFVDLDYMPGSIDWNVHPLRKSPSRLQVNINIPFVNNWWWELDGKEAALAKTGFVNVSTFFKHPLQTEKSKPSTKKAKASDLESFFFGDFDIHLELPGHGDIQLGNAGSLTLGGGASPGFEIDVTSGALPAIKAAIPKLRANVSGMNLKLDTEGTVLKTGAITLDAGKDVELYFEDTGVGDTYTDDQGHVTQNKLPFPQRLSGTLSKASIRNVELQSPPDKKASP